MILKGLFGRNAIQSNRVQNNSNIVNFIERADLRIQKQLAHCMKDIQQLMAHQKAELKQKIRVKVKLQLV